MRILSEQSPYFVKTKSAFRFRILERLGNKTVVRKTYARKILVSLHEIRFPSALRFYGIPGMLWCNES